MKVKGENLRKINTSIKHKLMVEGNDEDNLGRYNSIKK